MTELSDSVSESVRNRLLKDMRPGAATVYLKSGLAVILGGALSLIVCGQFGVGITHAALHFADQFHTHGTSVRSVLMCGVAFAILPPFVLRLICTPLQFRFLTRNTFAPALIWLVGLGAVLAHHGETAVEAFRFGLWAMAAFGTFSFVARLIDLLVPSWQLSPEPRGLKL